ncbi:hypothetical protein [Brevundimonas sp.]|uniref:hypothetical protein n=1 Tax=Brevundimonas sp. TaxID=1871086 RepID=UPI003D6C84CE
MRNAGLALGLLLLAACSEPKHEVSVEVRNAEQAGRQSTSRQTQEVRVEISPEAAAALKAELKKAKTAP